MYIDIHSHLDMLKNPKKVVERAINKNVKVILANGVNRETNRKVLDFSEKFEGVCAVLGLYPIDALSMTSKQIDEEISFIEENKKKIMGVGEVGMDFSGELKKSDIGKQMKNFEKFIVLSKKLDIPITVHSRKAEEGCIEMLEKLKTIKVIMHYFSGKLKLVDRIIANGWFLSIPTCVKHSEHFQKIIERVSIDRLFCETDSPYSHPDKKFPNEPTNVVESYKKIAEIKNISLKTVEKKIMENYRNIFM